ncbi:hypothetical protein [Pseudomonas syringae]|uniref:hypothetical protein n=1 Tax=Pseudomonas syringae TaxID=317 RepID=UPI0006E5DE8D|nr:hypothetical protein [Pseudomonas syringae]KPY40359.1 hypothetical protein ALO48_200063 [Pseudomonas syringae pv. rhaphiolepidis]KWS46810.1 hypothetical protein AL060_10660 [Pseudomonas syringae pv. rhaphiolepidis]
MTYFSSLLLDIPGKEHGFETSANSTLPEGTHYCAQAHGNAIIDADVAKLAQLAAAHSGKGTPEEKAMKAIAIQAQISATSANLQTL